MPFQDLEKILPDQRVEDPQLVLLSVDILQLVNFSNILYAIEIFIIF